MIQWAMHMSIVRARDHCLNEIEIESTSALVLGFAYPESAFLPARRLPL